MSDEHSVGYRKGKTVSRWVIRRRIDGRPCIWAFDGELPDETRPAAGKHVLSFQQLVEKLMTTQEKLACSCYGKPSTRVATLVAGPVCLSAVCVALCQLYMDYPEADGNLLLEDGKPMMRAGKPVCTPLNEAELAARKAQLGND